jgi:hypothetical protein
MRLQCCVYVYSSAENCTVSPSFDDLTFLSPSFDDLTFISSKNDASPSVFAFLKLLSLNFLPDVHILISLFLLDVFILFSCSEPL